MNELWPRISAPVARAEFEQIGIASVDELAAISRTGHAHETYAATGGTRIGREDIENLAKALRETATDFGYPDRSGDAERIGFDRAAAEVVFRSMNVTAVEASNRGVWSFLALVAMPDLTLWRFNRTNIERWVASDLTRHMFARLWWQALTFSTSSGEDDDDFSLLRKLSESDLNQIMERRGLAGNGRLARALARAVVSSTGVRREVIRDLTPRLRRRLAFVDFSVLTDEQLNDHIRALFQEAVRPRL